MRRSASCRTGSSVGLFRLMAQSVLDLSPKINPPVCGQLTRIRSCCYKEVVLDCENLARLEAITGGGLPAGACPQERDGPGGPQIRRGAAEQRRNPMPDVSQSTPLDLDRFSEALRRRLYDRIVQIQFDPADS